MQGRKRNHIIVRSSGKKIMDSPSSQVKYYATEEITFL